MKHSLSLVIALIMATASLPAFAGVSKISSPTVTKGEAEIEYSATRYGDDRKSLNNKQSHTYELEYGFTDRFMLGLEAKSARESLKDHKFEGYGVEAQYELTNQGDWWLDSAIKGEYLHTPRSSAADEAELKLLAARSYGKSTLTINAGLERELGSNREHGLALSSAVQAKHSFGEHCAPGIEWHADYGTLNNLGHDATHYVGPVVTGELFEVAGHGLDYTVGYFWGVTDASADNAVRIQLGYELSF